ncbi:hypothetical protein D3C80_829910 [compost metagenome]
MGQADEPRQFWLARALEVIEVIFDEDAGQLTGPVGTEVHEDHGVAVLDLDRVTDTGGLDEFIAFATGIGRFQAFDGIGGVELGGAVDDQVVGGGYAVPAVVAVHGEVAADDAGDTALAQLGEGVVEQLQERLGAFRWRVAAIEEGVQVDLLGATLGGQFGHRHQVVLVAVNATVGQQAEDVHGLAAGHGLVHRAAQGWVLEELTITDSLGHAGEVLVDHTPGAQVHVADFGVAHLPIRQAHVHAGA